MPLILIRCTYVFYQGRLSRHIISPSEKTRPKSWPGNYIGKATPVWQLSSSTAATKCNEQTSQTTANPVGGKACSSTKVGLLRYTVNTYSIHKSPFEIRICILQGLNMPLICCTYVFLPREAIPPHKIAGFGTE